MSQIDADEALLFKVHVYILSESFESSGPELIHICFSIRRAARSSDNKGPGVCISGNRGQVD